MKAITKIKIISAILFVVVLLNWSTFSDLIKQNKDIVDLPIKKENASKPEAYFCPQDNCSVELIAWLGAAKESIDCAFFEVGLESVRKKLDEMNSRVKVRLVTDDKYFDHVSNFSFAKHDNRSGLMHNKFCVIDNKAVWTGSFNPTERGDRKNNNNAVFYQSQSLAEMYSTEFEEMWKGDFGKGKRSDKTEVEINGNKIEVYFCPEDWCSNKLIYALQDANKTIDFMTFSFTHDSVGDEVIRANKRGVVVRGVFEKSQNNKYLEYYRFVNESIAVRWDGNGANMHHKVFIIDGKTVVTGSFNPSNNGDKRNDENMIIIHDPEIAKEFEEEFERVYLKVSR